MAGDYENSGKATRPSFIDGLKAIRNTRKPPADRVELLAKRYAAGQDLWTGKPLRPLDTAVVEIPDEEDIDNENPIMQTSIDTFLL